ncbi:MAG TPA: hypothetical protein PKH07_18670 [bacterium]|nr:hypothetical protein [bacterium]
MGNKRTKFVSLAEARVTKACKTLRLIGNLSNRQAYEYSEDDVRKIFRTLQRDLEAAKARFTGDGGASSGGFKL